MARKISKPRKTIKQVRFQPEDLVLAGIGAVSLGRKQAASVYANGFEGIAQLRHRARSAVNTAAQKLNGTVLGLRKQASAKAAPIEKTVRALVAEARAQAQTRIAPVLAKLGPRPATPAKKRAPARNKAAGRSRKAA